MDDLFTQSSLPYKLEMSRGDLCGSVKKVWGDWGTGSAESHASWEEAVASKAIFIRRTTELERGRLWKPPAGVGGFLVSGCSKRPAVMICAQCHAKYPLGYSSCAKCHVALVRELSSPQEEELPPTSRVMPGDMVEDPFCVFWHGEDARLHSELCAVLEEAEVPYRTVTRTDRLFNTKSGDAFRISVPFSLFGKAEVAVKEAFGTDEETGAVAVLTLPAPSSWAEFSDDSHDDEDVADIWYPEDSTVEIWSGDPRGPTEKLSDSLRESRIHWRWMEVRGTAHLFVEPGDERRAREIVREILEGAAPK
jgi:ribosomal protein L40E